MIFIRLGLGTGKTSTLVEYTKRRPKKEFLNVSYNKSIQQHAIKSFPKNVTSSTIHSLAHRSVGKRYKHKLGSDLRTTTIMDALSDERKYLEAKRVEETLKNFMASADSTVNIQHVPEVSGEEVETEGESDEVMNATKNFGYLNSKKCKERVASQAENLWERMKDEKDEEFSITHDGYLKLYQLSKPTLEGFDCLLVDEAQDCTPAVSDILLRQSCAKILVGDPHQQIYAFRGARNALQEVTNTHTFYLTQSFRFGPEIALVASCLLNTLKGEQKTLVGVAESGQKQNSNQLCVITRSNYTVFDEAARLCCGDNNTKVGFVGGVKVLGLDRMLEVDKLFTAGTNNPLLDIKDTFINRFKSFHDLKRFAKLTSDHELLTKIKIVEAHHSSLKEKIENIKAKAARVYKTADVVFTTAHKAKGLEFERVRVTDDFLPATRRGEGKEENDEKNLAYVAVTRAKKGLEISDTIRKIIFMSSNQIGEY